MIVNAKNKQKNLFVPTFSYLEGPLSAPATHIEGTKDDERNILKTGVDCCFAVLYKNCAASRKRLAIL